ncbi:MAG: DEAD/DEAH box helicase family protein [Balneolales bacterium]|nr:DEAD/DEAH box helicase family protein [Balneolales bacterium]
MHIIDNREHGRVVDVLAESLIDADELHVISRTLSLFGYEALSDKLEELKSARLLLGRSVIDEDSDEIQQSGHIPALLGDRSDRMNRNRLIAPFLAEKLNEWLLEKSEIKVTNDPLNASYYGLHNNGAQKLAINGSSTFTSSGLGVLPSSGHEMNNASTHPDQLTSLHRWFTQIWNDSSRNEPANDLFGNALKQIFQTRSPETLYFKTLLEVFRDSMHLVDEDEVIKTRTGIRNTVIWNKLYSFQRDGVVAAISKIEQYNGCIIADSVGLGKTFEALAIIKYYELRNDRVLVLAPKKLRENWTVYTLNDKRNVFADDRFNYDVLNHTDLTRDGGISGDINLDTINWGTYDLVVIDESHNFRNNPAKKEGETRYGKLMREIIKQGVKTKVLMLSATPVNNRMNDLKNQVAFITEGRDDALFDSGIHSVELTLKKAQSKFNQWQKLEPDERITRRLLAMLGFDYFKLLDLLTIARSRKHITKYFSSEELGTFPERLKPVNKKPDIDLDGVFPPLKEINREIRLLNLAAYAPLKYLLAEKREEYSRRYDTSLTQGSVFRQVDREQSLIHLMRVNLLKRMESSIVAFTLTVEKLHRNVIALLERATTVQEVGELSIEDIDLEEDDLDGFLIGNKIKVLIQDLDLIRWKQELEEDRDRLLKLLRYARSVSSRNDAKLADLKAYLTRKVEEPINPGNRKAIIFTAFADTARYLYDQLQPWVKENLGLHSAMVLGGTGNNMTSLAGINKDLLSIITAFSPISKERAKTDPEATAEIDLLIATDCISEGQNLQDCDLVINYDIHWNPVRIIQRFGRIDRLGSVNKRIQLVNYWPNMELDEYINLEARVSGRMVLLDISATGEENVIEYQGSSRMNDLEYRRRQMEQLHEEVVDLEDLGSGISITDLTLNDFRQDLVDYLKNGREILDKMPIGCRAVVDPDEFVDSDEVPSGVIFCLRSVREDISADPNYALSPYFLAFAAADGSIHIPFTQTRSLLDLYKQLCIGNRSVQQEALSIFMKHTRNGSRMGVCTKLLNQAVLSVIGKSEEQGLESLFTRGGTRLGKQDAKGLEDFEVVSYLIIDPKNLF